VRLLVESRIQLNEFAKKIFEIIENERKSMMILMNTIGSATYLYNVLAKSFSNSGPLEYLSAELLPIHRERKLKLIHDKLSASEPLVLVTTQVVEAGVNLDFDNVIRDMGPVDSIIQAAGRCNREGNKDPSKSHVKIFEVYDGNVTFCRQIYGDFAIEKAHSALRRWNPEKTFSELAQLFYQETREGLSNEKSRQILEGLGRLDYEKLREFVIIEEIPSCSVFIEWDEKAIEVWKEYESLSQMDHKRRREKFLEIKKDLYKYVINVPEKYASGVPKNNGFGYVSYDQLEKFYDERTGFKREPPSSII
jgi:CRISPR-associated endonuclease/helicase Cas3